MPKTRGSLRADAKTTSQPALPAPPLVCGVSVLVVDEPVELGELSTYYESLMVADDKFEAALIQSDI